MITTRLTICAILLYSSTVMAQTSAQLQTIGRLRDTVFEVKLRKACRSTIGANSWDIRRLMLFSIRR